MSINFSCKIGFKHRYEDRPGQYEEHVQEFAEFDLGNWRVLRSLIKGEDCCGSRTLNYREFMDWITEAESQGSRIPYVTWPPCRLLIESLRVDEDETSRLHIEVLWG